MHQAAGTMNVQLSGDARQPRCGIGIRPERKE